VHVNDPAEAFAIARRFGKVSAEKADDMLRQERSLKADGRRVAIVADSGADLPAAAWDDFGIQMVPLRVNFGSESHLDKVGMSATAFWAELARNPVHPKTSQPPPGDFRRAYELLSSHFEHVVSVSLTGRLSGTLQAAQSAASRVSKPGQLTIVDSKNVSVGMGLIVLTAAEHARAGKSSAEVVAAVERAATRTRTYGAIPDLSYAVRGGRIPQPWRWLAGILPLGFLLAIDDRGGVKVRGILRRKSDRVSALIRIATQDRLLKSGATPLRPLELAGTGRGTAHSLRSGVPERGIRAHRGSRPRLWRTRRPWNPRPRGAGVRTGGVGAPSGATGAGVAPEGTPTL
jgi:DegV family protein with EDD domain